MANWTTLTAKYEHPIARSDYYCPDCGTNVPTLGPYPKLKADYEANTDIDVSNHGEYTMGLKDAQARTQTFYEDILALVPDDPQTYIYIENNDVGEETYGTMYRTTADGSGYVQTDEFVGQADRNCLDNLWHWEDNYGISPRIK